MKKYSLLLVLFLLAGECTNPCKDVDCGINGTCIDGTCECDTGWTGAQCEVDMCADVLCDHGDCVAGLCECDEGWEGTLCDDCSTECGIHGACNDAGACVCTDGYTGTNCETPPAAGTYCSNTCSFADDGECDDGGPGSAYSVCDCGTDCIDCGTRTATDCGGGPTNDAAIAVWFDGTDGGFPCNTDRIDVYIDDTYEGFLDSYYTSTPACGDGGTVTIEVQSGTHTVYAECNDGDTYWGPADFSVDAGYCLIIDIGPNKSFSVKVVKMPNNLFQH